MRSLDSITDSVDMNLSKLWEIVEDKEALHATVHGIVELDTISDWATIYGTESLWYKPETNVNIVNQL